MTVSIEFMVKKWLSGSLFSKYFAFPC